MSKWIRVCRLEEMEVDDVRAFEHDGKRLAVYRLEDGVYATDGHCTHEVQDLSDGFVIDNVIECPLHGGQFDIVTGKALTPPVCIDLATYEVRVENGEILVAM